MALLQQHEHNGRGHATRVARLTLALAEQLGISDAADGSLEHGALRHDIGTLGMPASILAKPAALDEVQTRRPSFADGGSARQDPAY